MTLSPFDMETGVNSIIYIYNCVEFRNWNSFYNFISINSNVNLAFRYSLKLIPMHKVNQEQIYSLNYSRLSIFNVPNITYFKI